MKLLLNGESRETNAQSIPSLLAELGLPPVALLIEHNRVALRREEWETTSLAENDRLEIIRIVAGG